MKKNLSLIIMSIMLLASLAVVTYFKQRQEDKNRILLNIYAPCGLALPLKELSLAFEASGRNVKIETTLNDAAALANLILKEKKTPDLFISMGEKEIWRLNKQGLLDAGSIKTFGKYELILIAPKGANKINNLEDLFKDTVKTFAIVNPDYNSIGAYSIMALTKLGYWDTLQAGKLIMFTNTPREVLSSIATNKADAGIYYNVCPFKTDPGKIPQGAIKVFAQLPADSHPLISNYIAVLNESQNKELAKSFIDFIFSARGQKILFKYGLGKSTLK